MPAESPHPTTTADVESCPICLSEIADSRLRAVVLDCMHGFCEPCISRWSKLRRQCPLCKGFFKSFIHDIRSATDFKERQLSPLRSSPQKQTEQPVAAILADAQEYVAWQFGLSDAARTHQGSQDRHRHRRRSSSSNPERQTRNERGQLTEPRPYYYRLQRHQNARAAGTYGQPAAVLQQPDAVLDWRRSLYTQGLWAHPVALPAATEPSAPAAAAPLATSAAGQRRLEEWVARELRALLQQEDVAIVKGLVMGLVRSHGLEAGSRAAAGSHRQVTCVDALQPFLHEQAQHFWHELRSFAAAPYSIASYDRLVQYCPANEPASARSTSPQRSRQAAADHRPAARASRWDVHTRRPANQPPPHERHPQEGIAGDHARDRPVSSGSASDHWDSRPRASDTQQSAQQSQLASSRGGSSDCNSRHEQTQAADAQHRQRQQISRRHTPPGTSSSIGGRSRSPKRRRTSNVRRAASPAAGPDEQDDGRPAARVRGRQEPGVPASSELDTLRRTALQARGRNGSSAEHQHRIDSSYQRQRRHRRRRSSSPWTRELQSRMHGSDSIAAVQQAPATQTASAEDDRWELW